MNVPSLFDFGVEILSRQIDYTPVGKMHQLLAYYFEKAVRKEIRRLHVSCPPQHAKSTWLTIATAYGFGLDPYMKVIRACYAEKLSLRDSLATKRLIQSEVFQKYFGEYPLVERSSHRWGFNWPGSDGRPNFISASVGAPGIGESASLCIADDLLSGMEAAESEADRDAAWYAMSSGLLTRLPQDGVLISIATRWSEDDPPGRLIKLYEANPGKTPPLVYVNIRWDGQYEETAYGD